MRLHPPRVPSTEPGLRTVGHDGRDLFFDSLRQLLTSVTSTDRGASDVEARAQQLSSPAVGCGRGRGEPSCSRPLARRRHSAARVTVGRSEAAPMSSRCPRAAWSPRCRRDGGPVAITPDGTRRTAVFPLALGCMPTDVLGSGDPLADLVPGERRVEPQGRFPAGVRGDLREAREHHATAGGRSFPRDQEPLNDEAPRKVFTDARWNQSS